MKRVLIALIRLYQLTLTSVIGPRCRFYPSCSAYASEAIEIHGIVKGSGLAASRICKCHPFNPGGFDPVPAVDSGQLDEKQNTELMDVASPLEKGI